MSAADYLKLLQTRPPDGVHSSHARDVEAMLSAIGVSSIEQLFDEIPASLRVKSLDVRAGWTERDADRAAHE